MKKNISTIEWILISLVCPIGSAKSHFIYEWLKIGAFQPLIDSQMRRKNFKFDQEVDFDLIGNTPNNGTK